jgi:hypothetical protein
MVNVTFAQCENWVGSPQEGEASDAHVNYRQYLSKKDHAALMAMEQADFDAAFKFWQKAYDLAPAADGQRPFHYRDGRALYRVMHAKETDAAIKTEHATRLLSFYDEELACYAEGAESFLYGRKGYDQFYLVGYSMDALESLNMALEKGGNDTEYIILAPMGKLISYLFSAGKLDKAQARYMYDAAVQFADYNIENNKGYKTYFESGKANLVSSVSEIEDEIFDCAYFKEDLLPEFEKNMEDMEVVRYVLEKLKKQGCEETDADVIRVQAKYDLLYASRAAEYEAERRRLNPAYDASKMIEDEDYNGAIGRYQDAIDAEEDNVKKAQYYYQMATIQSGKLGQTGVARTNANKAASLNSSWGKPFILIGDIYSRMSRDCGDSWQQRLAILAAIDKYSYAKSVDPEVASDANKRIGNYQSSLPLVEEGFQRNVKAGDRVSVGCGIGETVTVRFQ